MIYISKLELVNFQSHKNTIIEFDKGLNVIIGNSDSGKTSVIRAIKWALFNEPQGDSFIRQGESKCWVTVYFNTGALVRRLRTASKNSYYLKKSNGEEFNFEAFGRNIPKEIIEEINMFKIEFDENTNYILNIAEQLEGPFLINEKPSLRASAIGRIVKVNLVDNAMRDTIRDRKNTQYHSKILAKEVEDYKEQIKTYDFLDEKIKICQNLKNIREKIKNLKAKYELYLEYKNSLDRLELEIKESQDILNKYRNLDKLIYTCGELEKLSKSYYLLVRLRDAYAKNKYEIKENLNIIKLYNNTDIIDKIYQKIYHVYFSSFRLMNDYNISYKKVIGDIEENKKILEKYKSADQIKDLSLKIDDRLSKFKNLSELANNYKILNSRVSNGKIFLEKFRGLDNLEDLYRNLINKIDRHSILKRYMIDFNNLVRESNDLDKIVKKDNQNIEILSEKYLNTLLELGHCPYCMSKIDDDVVSHLKHEL